MPNENRRAQEHRGPLTPAAAATGMNAAIRNAQRLAEDAAFLLEAKRYPTAAALAALSIEESGKVSILRHLAGITDAKAIEQEWRRYRDHRSKNGAWIVPSLVRDGARRLHEFAETINRAAEHTAVLNSLKQIALYTDCFGNGHWSEPVEVIDAELAQSLVQTAVLLAPKRFITVREMELYVEIVSPARGTSDLPHALVRWASAIYDEGLSDTPPEQYVKFIFGEGEGEWVFKPRQRH